MAVKIPNKPNSSALNVPLPRFHHLTYDASIPNGSVIPEFELTQDGYSSKMQQPRRPVLALGDRKKA